MKKWMQSLVAAALLVSMVAVEAVTPMTAYATEAEDEETTEIVAEETEPEEDTTELEAGTTSVKSDEPATAEENVPRYLDGDEEAGGDENGGDEPNPESEPDPVELSIPDLGKATADPTGTTITWSKVTNADSYTILRSTSNGTSAKWEEAGTATGTSYTDTASLSGGKTYYYTVQACSDDATLYTNSSYNTNGLKTVYLANPSLSSAKTPQSGVTELSWKKVTGASGYAVYRKLSGGGWSKITTTTSTSYTDTAKLTSGKTYYYTVRAYYGNADTAKSHQYDAAYWGGYNSTGLTAVYLSTPSINTAEAAASGTKISWKAVSGAKGYAVYRKKSGGSWSMIGTTTSKSYVDKASLSAGKTYYYTVRAYYGSETTAKNNRYNAAYWSGYNNTGVKSVYLATPTLKSIKSTNYNAYLTWNKVSSAKGYAVYRKKAGGGWSMIATTTSTNYKDTSTLTGGATYYYTVRAYRGGNSTTAKKNKYKATYWSGYDANGLKFVAKDYGADMDKKAQSYSSKTKYLILVNTKINKVSIYTGSKGNWTRKYLWTCTTGKSSTPTPIGQYTTGVKGRYFNGDTYTAWWKTQIHNGVCFHSILYQLGSSTKVKDGRLGINASHGCVRLAVNNAKWIYNNVPKGTKVVTYK